MNITLPWGPKKLELTVPDGWTLHFPKPESKNAKPPSDELAPVRAALGKPVGMSPLAKMKLKGKKVVIITDDNTRPTPVHKFLHLVLRQLAGAGAKSILVIPGLGIHTPMKEDEMAQKLGAANMKKVKWENHFAFDPAKNTYFGTTRRGTRVFLNSRLAEADLILSLGMVEPHLWAGFGGGMKNILPGVASVDTIAAHHSIIAEPPYRYNRVGMMPDRNSFRADLEEIISLIKAPVFCLNVVVDHKRRILAAFAGHPVDCHREAIAHNVKIAGCRLPRKMDAIIVNSFPMDLNFKQSMKCVGNSLPALKTRGTIIGFLRAERGMDDIVVPEKSKPMWLVKTILRVLGPSRVLGFLEKIRPGLNVEEKFLLYYSMQLLREFDLYFHVPTIKDDEVKRLGFFVHAHHPQEIVDIAAAKIGARAHVAVFPEGGSTFPLLDE